MTERNETPETNFNQELDIEFRVVLTWEMQHFSFATKRFDLHIIVVALNVLLVQNRCS